MKILVTGSNSRQANPEASVKDVTFAWLLAEALRDAGHDVEHRNPDITEDLSDFDHVFLGIAPLHAMGSNRAYGALAVVLRTISEDNKLTIFIDDPDVGKVVSGLRTMANEPKRLTKPFFAYKLQHAVASSPEYASWLSSGVTILNEHAWPRLLVPFHTWARAEDHYDKRVPQAAGNIHQLDLSAYLPTFDLLGPEEIKKQWVYEGPADDRWYKQQRPTIDVYRIGKNGEKKLANDERRLKLYTESWGVLEAPVGPPGWWSARMGYAVQAGVPYVTRWQDLTELGEPYTVLPDRVAMMSLDDRSELAQAQAAMFVRNTPGRLDVQYVLNSMLEPKKVSA